MTTGHRAGLEVGFIVGLVLIAGTATMPAAQTAATPAHDKAFWRKIAADKFAVPAGQSASALARELSSYLGSADPELRDDIAYTTLASWIYRQRLVPPADLRALMDEWTRNLSAGIGESGTDSVFKRSFSALALGIVAILDNEAPFLERPEFDRLLAAALTYLGAERDIRGHDAAKGWIHSVAHTADLLKFLARNKHLTREQQAAILTGISEKLGHVEEVLTHGEDERLARAVLSLAARPDLDAAGFEKWLATFVPARRTGPPTPATMAIDQNRKNLIVSLFAVLSTDPRDLATLPAARDQVLGLLKKLHGVG
jgi:uncharacterized protein DUF2785